MNNMEAIQTIREALEYARDYLGTKIGCRCSIDDCEAGDCDPCRAYVGIDHIANALAALDTLVTDIDVVRTAQRSVQDADVEAQ